MPRAVILLNGQLDKSSVRLLKSFQSDMLISADGASDFLFKNNLTPYSIIGDLDSIAERTLTHFRKTAVRIIRKAGQEQNDFEKAILFALKKKIREIFVIGYSGGRTDHLLNNFSVMKKYSSKCNLKLIDGEFECFISKKKTVFSYPEGEIISLIAFPDAYGIKTSGLRYPLDNENLSAGKRQGALNSASEKRIEITYNKGTLMIIKKHFGRFL
jgi:thiamine pyrophosphokinase